MREFYSQQHADRQRKGALAVIWLSALLVFASLTVCIVLACTARTATAALHERIACITAAAAGTCALFLLFSAALPRKAAAEHEKLMTEEGGELLKGTVSVTPGSFRIPKSVPVCRVLVTEPGAEPVRLLLDSVFRKELAAAAEAAGRQGTMLEIRQAHGFVTAYRPAEDVARGRKRSAGFGFKGRLKSVLSHAYLYVAWILLAVFFWGWIFTFVTDTTKYKKVVLYADVPEITDTALSEALEESRPKGIRMIPVHPFSFAVMDGDALYNADMYILPASKLPEFAESAADLRTSETGDPSYAACLAELESLAAQAVSGDGNETGTPGDKTVYTDEEGRILGIRIYSRKSGKGAAASFISYRSGPDEDYYLVLNHGSVHLKMLNGQRDDAAFEVARKLLLLE